MSKELRATEIDRTARNAAREAIHSGRPLMVVVGQYAHAFFATLTAAEFQQLEGTARFHHHVLAR